MRAIRFIDRLNQALGCVSAVCDSSWFSWCETASVFISLWQRGISALGGLKTWPGRAETGVLASGSKFPGCWAHQFHVLLQFLTDTTAGSRSPRSAPPTLTSSQTHHFSQRAHGSEDRAWWFSWSFLWRPLPTGLAPQPSGQLGKPAEWRQKELRLRAWHGGWCVGSLRHRSRKLLELGVPQGRKPSINTLDRCGTRPDMHGTWFPLPSAFTYVLRKQLNFIVWDPFFGCFG